MTNQRSKCALVANSGSCTSSNFIQFHPQQQQNSPPIKVDHLADEQNQSAAAEELCSLFPFLIHLCLAKSSAQEQHSIARYSCQQQFTPALLEQHPTIYGFLSSATASLSSSMAAPFSCAPTAAMLGLLSPRRQKLLLETRNGAASTKNNKARQKIGNNGKGTTRSNRRKSSTAKDIDEQILFGLLGRKPSLKTKHLAQQKASAAGKGSTKSCSSSSAGPSSPRHGIAKTSVKKQTKAGGGIFKSKSTLALTLATSGTSPAQAKTKWRRPGTSIAAGSGTIIAPETGPNYGPISFQQQSLTPQSSRPNTSCGSQHRHRIQSISDQNFPLLADDSSILGLGGSVRQFTNTEMLQRLCKAIEFTSDNLCAILLCRLLRGFLKHCKVDVSQRRLRTCANLDATSHLLRTIKARLLLLDGQEQQQCSTQLINTSAAVISGQLALDSLAQTLLLVATKDGKFSLKIRLSGLLPVLAHRVLLSDSQSRLNNQIETTAATALTTTTMANSLLRLMARCLRSARNAQSLGRERHFAERFVCSLNMANANFTLNTTAVGSKSPILASPPSDSRIIPTTPLIVSHGMPMPTSLQLSTGNQQLQQIGAQMPEAIAAEMKEKEEGEGESELLSLLGSQMLDIGGGGESGATKMARLVECLFFLAKHKRNKSQLLDQQCLPVLKTIFETHFHLRSQHPLHQEIALVALASLRQFAKTKKGRLQLMAISTLDMCERFIAELAEEQAVKSRTGKGEHLIQTTNAVQLQDSLCALCLRCLPAQPLPYRLDQFPVRFALPKAERRRHSLVRETKGKMKQQQQKAKKKQISTRNCTAVMNGQQPAMESAGEEETPSSDEDYGFWASGNGDMAATLLGGGEEEEDLDLSCQSWANESAAATAAADGQPSSRGREEAKNEPMAKGEANEETKTVAAAAALLAHSAVHSTVAFYSSQPRAELMANYQKFFAEFNADSPGRPTTIVDEFSREEGQHQKQHQSYEQIVRRHWTAPNAAPHSVIPFAKIAFPELFNCGNQVSGSLGSAEMAANERKHSPVTASPEALRQLIVQKMAAQFRANQSPTKEQQQLRGEGAIGRSSRRIVFDLDTQLSEAKSALDNLDSERLGPNFMESHNNGGGHLRFESRFESGNLWKAVQIGPTEYELLLSPDINQQSSHFQWFNFEVSGMRRGVEYTFEVVNCLKSVSMFSRGMQPVLFSVAEAVLHGRPGWVRAGSEISYFRNLYAVPAKEVEEEMGNAEKPLETPHRHTRSATAKKSTVAVNGNKSGGSKEPMPSHECSPSDADKDKAEGRNFFSLRFTLKFPHDGDICYIAYHFPYTHSRLQCSLESWLSSSSSSQSQLTDDDPSQSRHRQPQLLFHRQQLCKTLAGNPVPLLTISSPSTNPNKKLALITARVHPGESNSSWIMHGLIQFLLSAHPLACRARELFVFKLVPMLNPDGVINGSHRCSLAGQDLNRVWNDPSPTLHPTIYHTKGLIQYAVEVLRRPPFVFIDLHGHSRKANVFMYGNNPEESWLKTDHQKLLHHQEPSQFSLLPEILDKISDSFSLKDCAFSITRAKEFSARVTAWRQFQLERVYTCESTYWGFDNGPKARSQITIADLKRMGAELVEGLIRLHDVVHSAPVAADF